MRADRTVKICFIGGGSQNWAPSIVRDIIFKEGMEKVSLDLRLLDLDMPRAQAIKGLFDVKLREWGVDRVKVAATTDPAEGLADVDFVLITISTGRLKAMSHDLAVPEKYGIYHTVGDTAGPGGWSRALRSIPVFSSYAKLIKHLAPNAFVLNYTNPLAALTKVLADELGSRRVVGLCHGLFEVYHALQAIFGLENENDIDIRFGGVNHFFWILDFKIRGRDGYPLLREKIGGRTLVELLDQTHMDAFGWKSDRLLAGELFDNYGYLPYLGDRHTCEFFGCYITDLKMMERFKLVRTSIAEREAGYKAAAERIRRWTAGEEADVPLTQEPSRETAADIIKAIALDERFTDVVNTINTGQVPNLPAGVVLETLGSVDSGGFSPHSAGPLPDSVRATLLPHADLQVRTAAAGLSGDEDAALMALAADPVCAHLTISDIKKMGRELIDANRPFTEAALRREPESQ